MKESRHPHTCCVTGGAGFIGSHLVDELLGRGHRVRVIDNLSNGRPDNLSAAASLPGYSFMQDDILEPEACGKAVKGCDVVYHLACLGIRHSLHSPVENHRVNAEGTLNMLEASVAAGVKKFYYISSSEVYGATREFPITETTPTVPTTVYGASKLVGEYYSAAYGRRYGMDVTVLRIFNNYGPRSHHEGDAGEMIPRCIVRILYGLPPILFGDGSTTRDFFFVNDTARALADLVHYDALAGETICIGAGQEVSMKAIVDVIGPLLTEAPVSAAFLEARPADLPRLWVDSSKHRALTGFKPRVGLEEGLRKTIEYFRAQMQHDNLLEQILEINWRT